MLINKRIIRRLENCYRKTLKDDFKRFLFVKYSQEPFPFEYSEDDLYSNIYRDLNSYESGRLDVSVKSETELWQEERQYLQELYIEKSVEVSDILEYVSELESILSEHNLESPRMIENKATSVEF